MLLNGRDLLGWELVAPEGVKADLAAICRYQADGSLAVAGKPMSFLATKESYENYRLHLEWRWPTDAAKTSNSGVLIHVASGPKDGAWPTCFQAQLKLTRAGDILPMAGAKFAEKITSPAGTKNPQVDRLVVEASEKPLGEWNSYDIVCRGDIIEVSVNGLFQNRVTRCVPASGRIAIQLEGTPYELRNIRLEALPRAIDSTMQFPPAKDPKSGKF